MRMSDRLEEIKEWFNADEELHQFQIEWLIQQAERVEEFEEALNFYADPRIWKHGKQVDENHYEMPEANNDGGKTARKVLRKINAI